MSSSARQHGLRNLKGDLQARRQWREPRDRASAMQSCCALGDPSAKEASLYILEFKDLDQRFPSHTTFSDDGQNHAKKGINPVCRHLTCICCMPHADRHNIFYAGLHINLVRDLIYPGVPCKSRRVGIRVYLSKRTLLTSACHDIGRFVVIVSLEVLVKLPEDVILSAMT